jgi:hypothetical protein
MTEVQLEAYRKATRLVSDWLASEVTARGTLGDELDLIAYYHAPNLLAATGHATEAQRVAGFLAREALAPDGDFRYHSAKGEFIKPSMQWNYINGWLLWGLSRLGRFDASEPGARFLERFQDESTGGFLTAADPDQRFRPVHGAVDMGSTCAAALGMIYTGRWYPAVRAAEFLLEALRRQPDEETAFFARFDSGFEALTGFPESEAYVSVVRYGEPRQAYWYFGFAARILALLYRATGRGEFLDGALAYVSRFERCHPDRYEHWANDKIAWASAALFQITGEKIHRERVGRIFDPIVAAQRADAFWHWKAFFDTYQSQPRGIRIELALEFAFLLDEIVSELESRPAR